MRQNAVLDQIGEDGNARRHNSLTDESSSFPSFIKGQKYLLNQIDVLLGVFQGDV